MGRATNSQGISILQVRVLSRLTYLCFNMNEKTCRKKSTGFVYPLWNDPMTSDYMNKR